MHLKIEMLLTCVFFPCWMFSCQDNLGTDNENSMKYHLLETEKKKHISPVNLLRNLNSNDWRMTHSSTLIKTTITCCNIDRGKTNAGMRYRWKGALSQYLAEFEVIWLLFAGLRHLNRRLRVATRVLATRRCTDGACLRHWALHAGAVAAACAWYSEWRAGVWVVSYHWWMRTGTDDNAGLNGHNIILERQGTGITNKPEFVATFLQWGDFTLNVFVGTHNCFTGICIEVISDSLSQPLEFLAVNCTVYNFFLKLTSYLVADPIYFTVN